MPANIVVGTQWGDEGKGKIIDIMASRADVVVRATGRILSCVTRGEIMPGIRL